MTLISFLVGLILAFIGAVQLRKFGAQIYVADLVGLAVTREMGAIMTGVILAGRTGAAFAAQLGTMQVNEEIDALITMGIPPMEFLVLPRMLALMLMMPLLCVYADLVGILAGLLVSTTLLQMPLLEYLNETRRAVDLVDCGIGVGKSVVFGALVALAGCLRGMQSGRSAAAVGAAATSAVVTGIVWIIASDGLFAVLDGAPRDLAGKEDARHDSNDAPHCRQGSHHGLRECGHSTRRDLQRPAGGDLHHYGRQRVRQEHPVAVSHGALAPGPRGGVL